MLTLPPTVRIFVALPPADMRCSLDGLAALTREVLREDPLSGHRFVFFNRRRNRTKILLWDRRGLCLYYKRLEKGVFRLAAFAQAGHHNDRSYAYGYDALGRLRAADLGVLSSSPPWRIVATPGVPSRSHTWTPDLLGNWVGDPNDPNYPFGLQVYIDADGNGQSEDWITTIHEVNPANQITQITRDDSQVGEFEKQPVYDRAGNLVWDGRYFFQYDGFNRLVQVNATTPQMEHGSFDADGRLTTYGANFLGLKLAAFTYDGLGRLIRTQRWRSGGATQVAEYYYDGVRRIQEVETTTGGSSPGTVTREYVWGPGYADEIVCQLDYSADPLGGTGVEPETYYYLQDANYNVVAVVQPAGGGYPAQVLYQYTYGPYGDVLAADAHPTLPLPVNRIGHQGLFFERLTGAIGDPALLPSDPSIPRTVRGLYNSRNRWLHVELGRFLTRDPAEAALPIITALAFNGDTLDGLAAGTATLPFSPTGHYGDGFNLYEFVGSNPVVRRDPSGLIWGFAGELLAMAWGADLRASDAARVSAGYAALATGLAAITAQMQWTIGGGMSASGFDLFLEGIDATMSGAYAVGESMIRAGEVGILAAYSVPSYVRKLIKGHLAVIAEHLGWYVNGKGGEPPNDNNRKDWRKHIAKHAREILKKLEDVNNKSVQVVRDYARKLIEWAKGGGQGPPPTAPAI